MQMEPALIRELLIKAAKGEVKVEPHLLCSAYWAWRRELGMPPVPRRMLSGCEAWRS